MVLLGLFLRQMVESGSGLMVSGKRRVCPVLQGLDPGNPCRGNSSSSGVGRRVEMVGLHLPPGRREGVEQMHHTLVLVEILQLQHTIVFHARVPGRWRRNRGHLLLLLLLLLGLARDSAAGDARHSDPVSQVDLTAKLV